MDNAADKEDITNIKDQQLPDELIASIKSLTIDEQNKLNAQNSRLVSAHQAVQLEQNARRHWDIFYKRNETRFFKDRHWTTREFQELLTISYDDNAGDSTSTDGIEKPTDQRQRRRRHFLEVGCGVGNLIFPLIAEHPGAYFVHACDFSDRAVAFVRDNPLYDAEHMNAFQCDITEADTIFGHIPRQSVDIITMVFVLSAIHPDNFHRLFANLFELLRPGGSLLFRDYGRYDMAQLRFKAGHKIDENFYMRQDGTRSYYFEDSEVAKLGETVGFRVQCNGYVHRRTINVKEMIDAPRIFVQTKFTRPL